ncbi:four helix bundle protein [Candidatus Peregrinibacteria bacterium]|nr:four helix bundle protein [Candidatus Peregrinibacteria bacterium]
MPTEARIKIFANFLNKSHTSLNEVVACLDSAFQDGYISDNDVNYYLEKALIIANQLIALRKNLLMFPTK